MGMPARKAAASQWLECNTIASLSIWQEAQGMRKLPTCHPYELYDLYRVWATYASHTPFIANGNERHSPLLLTGLAVRKAQQTLSIQMVCCIMLYGVGSSPPLWFICIALRMHSLNVWWVAPFKVFKLAKMQMQNNKVKSTRKRIT